MKNFLPFLFIALFGILAVGCKNEISNKHTAELDSAIAVIQADLEGAQSLNTDKLEAQLKVYDEFFDFYSNEYNDISQSEFYTHELADMAECRKYTRKTHGMLNKWTKELELTLKQLKGLKHDYANNLMPEDEFLAKFQIEFQASYAIHADIQKYMGRAFSCNRNFEELTHKLDSAKTAFLSANE